MSEKLKRIETLYVCVGCGKEVEIGHRKYQGRIPVCPECGVIMKKVTVVRVDA
jgi:DNA-directed RNA polymerase subunit RPC12/RpoP